MKHLIAMLLVLILLSGTGLAAQWPEGTSPERPYEGLPKVNLSEKMGYMVMYPKANLPAERFCDTLYLFLPREDIELGSGTLYVMDANGVIASVDFSNSELVRQYPLTDEDLEGLMWGSGTCIEIHLPVSLKFGDDSFILMDAGCFTAADGAVLSAAITDPDEWRPVVNGQYGIGRLCYYALLATQPAEVSLEGTTPPEQQILFVTDPGKGDHIAFDLMVGGEANGATVYSADNSVVFNITAVEESMTISGDILEDDWEFSVFFTASSGIDEDPVIVDEMYFTSAMLKRED